MKVILTSFKKQGKNGYSNDQEKSSHKQLHDDQRMIGLIYISCTAVIIASTEFLGSP